jgi:hypothetical protein
MRLRARSGKDLALPGARRGGIAFGVRQQHGGADLAACVVQMRGTAREGAAMTARSTGSPMRLSEA